MAQLRTAPSFGLVIHLAVVIGATASLPGRLEGQIHCDVLRTAAQTYAGRCVMNARTISLLVLHPPASGGRGRWEGTRARVFGVTSDSTEDIVDWSAFGPDFVDTGPDSLFGSCWCKVTRAHVDQDGLHFDADPDRRAPPRPVDLQVLNQLRNYYSDSSRWNRHSDRSRGVFPCVRGGSSQTLYCAMRETEEALRGEFYLSTPAAVAIREAIREVAPSREYQHPLDGFNNDVTISFSDFQRMLDVALRRVREGMERS